MTLTELITHFARYVHRLNDADVTQVCGLAEGTAANTLKTTQAITYQIYNTRATKAATDSIAMTACAAQGSGTSCYYLVSVNIAGTVTVTKGTDNAFALPTTPVGSVAIGAFKIVTVAVTFTSGTTDLSASGITATFYDIDCGLAQILINQAMQRMEQTYNFRAMKVKTSFVTVGGTSIYTSPLTNYKRLISAYAQSSAGTVYPLTKKDELFIETDSRVAFQTALQGPPKYIAEVPVLESSLTPDISPTLSWKLFPVPDVVYTVYLSAYQYSPPLDGVLYTTNWWTTYQWRTLLFEALIESASYLPEDARIVNWQGLSGLKQLVVSEREEQFAGSLQYAYPDNAY